MLFNQKISALSCAFYKIFLFFLSVSHAIAYSTTLKVQSFNIFEGGKGFAALEKMSVDESLHEIITILKKTNADIIGLQEVREDAGDGPTGKSIANKIAKALGYYVFDQSKYYAMHEKQMPGHPVLWANAILSRYPIVKRTPQGLGAIINVKGRQVLMMNIHLCDTPYVPYQIIQIPYVKDYPFIYTEEEAIEYANLGHKGAMDTFMNEFSQFGDGKTDLTIVTGDFNEPSHLDWTEKAVEHNIHPIKVEWPTTKRLSDAGFIDTYRAIFSDEVDKTAFTWIPTQTLPKSPHDHLDRIDFIFARAKNLHIKSAAIAGESIQNADIVYEKWPSDHRSPITVLDF